MTLPQPALSPFPEPAGTTGTEDECYHGGAFFEAIGNDFRHLERRQEVINADVLDAWFPPSPQVISQVQEHLAWLLQTSPPTQCDGLRRVLSEVRGIPTNSLVLGAGSSDLIFRAFTRWLTARSRVLLLDPTDGEYAHVLQTVIGCEVRRFPLCRAEGFSVDWERWSAEASQCDLAVLVNPNNPTGTVMPRRVMEQVLEALPKSVLVWVDEAYLDYTDMDYTEGSVEGAGSLEPYAAQSSRVIVCKSLSKVLALSGARAAYLTAPAAIARSLRRETPPWVIGLPAQVAAVYALQDPAYYRARYRETAILRGKMVQKLQSALPDWEWLPSPANWILGYPPAPFLDTGFPDTHEIVRLCRQHQVFLREFPEMGCIRIAVKDGRANSQVVETLKRATRNVP
ncbi:MAG: threonine-phosphate decarboxylase CobD [Armatimonadaceae bacterium]